MARTQGESKLSSERTVMPFPRCRTAREEGTGNHHSQKKHRDDTDGERERVEAFMAMQREAHFPQVGLDFESRGE